MNKKKIVVICGSILSILVIVVVIIMANTKEKVAIFFDVDGGIKVSRMTVNVGEKVKLPKTTKKGYDFDGWYDEDKKLENIASFTKETTLTAHWKEQEVKKMVITFNSVGGNRIEELTIECDKEFKLPTPVKEGYKFINWTDKKGTVITSDSKLTCEDITLKAKWEKEEIKEEKNETKKEEVKKEEVKKEESKEEPKKEDIKEEIKEEPKEEPKKEEKKQEYTCPSGYTINGDKCIIEEDVKTKCSDDTKEVDGKCVSTTNLKKTCTNGVLGDNNCYIDEIADEAILDEATCKSNGSEWNSDNNKCYSSKTDIQLSCPTGFELDNDKNSCYKLQEKEKYCTNGFTLNNDKCLKTIEATLE